MPDAGGEIPPDHASQPRREPELAPARETLDVPEWVSEMRRLYVEPKTRARMREEGVIAPQKKRQRGLPGVRSRRSADPTPPAPAAAPPGPAAATAPAAPVSPAASAAPVAAAPLAGPVEPVAPGVPFELTPALPGTQVSSAQQHELLGESGAGSATEREVATWLTSYLSAAGHDPDVESDPTQEHPTDEVGRSLAEPAEPAGLVDMGEAPPDSSEEAMAAPLDSERRAPVPGRPETVPAVTLSWREAEVFDVSIPEVETQERAIVVEPPSQVVAQSRSRRRPLDTAPRGEVDAGASADVQDDARADAGAGPSPTEPDVEPVPSVPDAPLLTRASARAASGYRSGKRRRILVVALSLVMLAVVAGYFLLAGGAAVASAP